MDDQRDGKLYLDEDVHKRIADALRMRGFDVLSTPEAGRIGSTDDEQLAYAAAEGRALVTFNVTNYIQLNKAYLDAGNAHCGIILSEQLPLGEMVKRLLRLLHECPAEELKNTIWWL